MNKIFVGIPSFNDQELSPTLNSLFNNAKRPEKLNVVVYNQNDSYGINEKFYSYRNITFIDSKFESSKGTGWIRNKIQNFYDNEEYTLWLDSHMRFSKDWDDKCINQIKKLKERSCKPILTNYLPMYIPDYEENGFPPELFDFLLDDNSIMVSGKDLLFIDPCFIMVVFSTFCDTLRRAEEINNSIMYKDVKDEFIPTAWLSLHFLFTEGNWNKEIKYDPDLFYMGDEQNIAIRSWTNGYDFYTPVKPYMWHKYKKYDIKINDYCFDMSQLKDSEEWRYKFKEENKNFLYVNRFGMMKNRNLVNGKKYEGFNLGTYRTAKEYFDYLELTSKCDIYKREDIMPYFHEAMLKEIVNKKVKMGNDFVKDDFPGFGINQLTIKG